MYEISYWVIHSLLKVEIHAVQCSFHMILTCDQIKIYKFYKHIFCNASGTLCAMKVLGVSFLTFFPFYLFHLFILCGVCMFSPSRWLPLGASVSLTIKNMYVKTPLTEVLAQSLELVPRCCFGCLLLHRDGLNAKTEFHCTLYM